MIRRALTSIALSLAFLFGAVLVFGVLANVFTYSSRAPDWLIVPVYYSFSWPLHVFSAAFPNTTCLEGHEICGYSINVYLATAVTLPLVYASVIFGVLTWRAQRASSKQA